MRALFFSPALLAIALIGGPSAALAQNEPKVCREDAAGNLACEYDTLEQCRAVTGNKCIVNPATTGRATVTPLPPPGGGEYLPPTPAPPSPDRPR
jgi:hypothetical protein